MILSRTDTGGRYLAAGLAASLVLHVGVGFWAAGFVRVPTMVLPNSKPVPATKEPLPKEPRIKLGVDDGRLSSLAWLGFREPTPHEAAVSAVEQSAMTPAPGSEGQPAPTRTPPRLNSALPPHVSSAQLREAAQQLSAMGTRLADAARDATKKAMAQVPAPTVTTPDSPAAEPTPQPAGGKAGHTGLASDKEAIATSIHWAPSIKLGQVAAAYGLDIQTKSPRWSITTQRTQRPANPTLKITFGRDGRVVRAEFASDGKRVYSTGSTEVDEPLLSAVYSWVARGQRLAELSSQDPNGEVTIYVRVLLVG